ncbi:hypothetical protein [Nocardia sp. NPDC052566]|uniref:hypothetical protein n=1 Tax=Nocardia sp. NPDC052566 TaxID=3364330 RepID=UPI0037C9FB88
MTEGLEAAPSLAADRKEKSQVHAALNHLYPDPYSVVDQDKHARLLDRIATEECRPEATQQAAEARLWTPHRLSLSAAFDGELESGGDVLDGACMVSPRC